MCLLGFNVTLYFDSIKKGASQAGTVPDVTSQAVPDSSVALSSVVTTDSVW
jgi:hypothetical protein